MAKITQVIPTESWELIGDQICTILSEELNNQVLLTYDETICTNVNYERTIPKDKSELPMVNVLFSSWEGETGRVGNGQEMTVTFFIDTWFYGEDTESIRGDLIAARRAKRTAGIIRSILMNPSYRTLDLANGIVGGNNISRANISETARQDSENMIMVRLTFEVKCNNNHELLNSVEWTEFNTQVKIGETEKGYKYKL